MSEKIRFYNKKTRDRKSKLPVLKNTNGVIIAVTDDEKCNALGNHFYNAVRTIKMKESDFNEICIEIRKIISEYPHIIIKT